MMRGGYFHASEPEVSPLNTACAGGRGPWLDLIVLLPLEQLMVAKWGRAGLRQKL
jgi:hypothetical protein